MDKGKGDGEPKVIKIGRQMTPEQAIQFLENELTRPLSTRRPRDMGVMLGVFRKLETIESKREEVRKIAQLTFTDKQERPDQYQNNTGKRLLGVARRVFYTQDREGFVPLREIAECEITSGKKGMRVAELTYLYGDIRDFEKLSEGLRYRSGREIKYVPNTETFFIHIDDIPNFLERHASGRYREE